MDNGTDTTEPIHSEAITPEKKKRKVTNPTARKEFLARMRRDGRYKALDARTRELKKEKGNTWHANLWLACREFGYTTAKAEHKLHAEWLASEKAKEDAVVQVKVDAAVGAIQAVSSFDEALTKLPVNADTKTENDWILAHPAMARKARSRDNLAPVLITADDILKANHGPAPSAAAAIRLQYWANKPDDIFKALTGAAKKVEGKEDKADDFSDVEDIADLDRLLKEMG